VESIQTGVEGNESQPRRRDMYILNLRRKIIHSEANVRGDCNVDEIVEVKRVRDYSEYRKKGFRFCAKCMRFMLQTREVHHVAIEEK